MSFQKNKRINKNEDYYYDDEGVDTSDDEVEVDEDDEERDPNWQKGLTPALPIKYRKKVLQRTFECYKILSPFKIFQKL